MEYSEKIRQKIRGKYYAEFENILKNKSATTINRVTKGHLIRKKIKIKRIYTMIMVKRITKLFRKNYEEKMKLKNEAAKKITYLIKKKLLVKKRLENNGSFFLSLDETKQEFNFIRQKKHRSDFDSNNMEKTSIINRTRHSRI